MAKLAKFPTPKPDRPQAGPDHYTNFEHGTLNFEPAQFLWNALDVMQPCTPDRNCKTCPLQPDCQGKGKHAQGFIPVDDLVDQFSRTDYDTWQSEMLCERPRTSDSVYPNFNIDKHVSPAPADPYYKHNEPAITRLAGMDFGLRSPTVMLWAYAIGKGLDAPIFVTHELVQTNLTLSACINNIKEFARVNQLPNPQFLAVDPAGNKRNNHTGLTDIEILKTHGYHPKSKYEKVNNGIQRLRRRFDHHALFIHPRCTQLIQSLTQYHFNPDNIFSDQPVKDGPDHLCDALRYMVSIFENPSDVSIYNYLYGRYEYKP